jgi:DNA polymerase (family 10)
MTNQEIVRLLRNIAAAYSIKDEKKYRFQLLAYQKAADAIESMTSEVKDLYKEDKLDTIPGVGSSIKSRLEELFKTGKVEHFETILQDMPKAMFPLLDIPSFGPKKAYKLVDHFKLENPDTVIEDLKKIAQEGKIATLDSFGEKSQSDILRSLNEYGQGLKKNVRMNLPVANDIADKMVAYMKKCPDVKEIYPLGSLRRRRDTIGDIDLAVATDNPKEVIEHFVNYPHKERILEQGTATAGLLVSGNKHIDLMTQPPKSFGSLLQHFTGSKNHNVHLRELALKKGLSVSEYGIKKQMENGEWKVENFDSEEEVYQFLGMQWIPPEIREDSGEIELAIKHAVPKLVELKDIQGDFHLHSAYPIEPSHDMGVDTMETMIEKARSLGYAYIGFSEHNPSVSKHTKQQVIAILKKRYETIEQINLRQKKSVRVFSLLETDILPDGSLAIPEEALQYLDATLVSIHSVFSMDKETMTARVLKGLSHPKAKILTHPSGRLINQRSGYELDWKKLFTFAKENNKAIEINAFPNRLDLVDTLVREAVTMGVKLVIDTDSHAVEQMDLMQFGVSVARRGWATKHDILNTMPYNELEQWLKS